jgi:predicted esterase
MRTRLGGLTPRVWPFPLLVLLVAVATDSPARAHVVILKDGFTLQGHVVRETTVISDPRSGSVFEMAKPAGFFMIDDEARRIIFSHRQVRDALDKDPARDAGLVRIERGIVRIDHWRLPLSQTLAVSPWNAKWDRVVTVQTDGGRVGIDQHLSILTPYFLRIDARRYNWSPHYLIREVDPDFVLPLLRNPPPIKATTMSEPAKRFRVFQFCAQAGWYDRALAELDAIAKAYPDQQSKVETSREELEKLVAEKLVGLIEQAQQVGRHGWARARLATVPRQRLEEKDLARVRTLEAAYESGEKKLAITKHWLEELPTQVGDTRAREVLGEAAATMLGELSLDTVDRLEAFQNFAAHNERKEHPPEELLALAVTGWLMGNNLAETKVESALRLWQARRLALHYQRTHDSVARQRMLAEYEKEAPISCEEFGQLLRTLPPAQPFEQTALAAGTGSLGALPLPAAALASALASLESSLSSVRYALHTAVPGSVHSGIPYFVRLPPEYHPGRAYPVLFALHEGNEKPDDMLKRWGPLAGQNGYLLVAPEWEQGLRPEYQFSPAEHATVTEVLRDLRRRFWVDSDRVFLAGFGEGANMAYDVGLSHPDLFAGVLPMSGRPHYFSRSYWPNAQHLPFYVVDGEFDPCAKANRKQFEDWVARGYASLYVEYKGRGHEWFDGELSNSFDWMNRKKRANAVPDLGRGMAGTGSEEYQSMRASDNRFYWLTTDGLNERHENSAGSWNTRVGAASIQGHIGEGNQISISLRGFKRVTVWLGPGMVDFDKPVSIRANANFAWPNHRVKPSLETLLEDFYQRGDRQRLFWAKAVLGN